MNRLLLLLAVAGVALTSFAARVAPGHAWSASVAPRTRVVLPLAHGVENHSSTGADADADEDSTGSGGGWGHFVRWVGHFHPPMTAFPLAMLVGAALAEVLLLARGAEWLRGAARWCVIVGAVGAMIAAPLGWAFATEHGHSRLLETHRWLGTASAAGAAVILLLSELSHRSARAGWRYGFRAVLFLALPLVLATGYFGGAMVYGAHAYSWNPHHSVETGGAAGQPDEKPATRPAGGGREAVTVTMTDEDAFRPASITIPAGTTVRWTNASKDEHTVTDDPKVASDAKDVSVPQGARPFNSGKIKPGKTYEQTFTVPGTYKYVCEPHEEMDMKGTVTVK